jgi:dolichol-phosphate mannosyltransferase
VGAHVYTKVLLGMHVNDATAGYRAYRISALRTIGLEGVESQGYCFQVDLTVRAVRAGLRIVEVPITFVEREIGVSKMGKDIIREALTNVTLWGLEYRGQQVSRLVRSLQGRKRS